MARILVGVCSWTDPTLLASGFYPEGTNTPEKRLDYYAQHFPLVEVDSTYYALPAQNTARRWVERTPAHFRFDVKAFSLFTGHPTQVRALPPELRPLAGGRRQVYYRDLPAAAREGLWQRFATALLPLDSAGKLGVVLFQFPPWFLPGRESQEHMLRCQEQLPQYRLAVEFRNGRWLEERHRASTLNFLRENGFSYVCVDEPQGFQSSLPPLVEATAGLCLVRFHGRNQENWERPGISAAERFQYFYSEPELREWLPRIEHLTGQAGEVHLLFNNCYSDWGVRNARDLANMLRAQPALFPDLIG